MALTITHLKINPTLPFLTKNKLRSPSSLPKRMNMTMFDETSYWATINADVDAHLERTLPIRDPLIVHQPIHDLVFATPKAMAPALCVAACELVGGQRADAIATASALNLMLAASYTHQYLPNLLERGAPSTFPNNIELLSGDAICPLGFELLARSDGTGCNSERVLRMIVEIARAMGTQGLVEGQYMHVKWSKGGERSDGDIGTFKQVCDKKEGRVYACGAACGAIVGGAQEEVIERLRRYGFYVGMMFGMLQGSYGIGSGVDGAEAAQGFRSLALKELEGFEAGKVAAISSLVNVINCLGVAGKKNET